MGSLSGSLWDLSGISLGSGSLCVRSLYRVLDMRRSGISLGSLWDLSSCWRVWDQKHNEEMWDLSRDLSGNSLGSGSLGVRSLYRVLAMERSGISLGSLLLLVRPGSETR